MSTRSTTPPPLTVGMSVSEPASEELVDRGLGELHVRHAFIEIVRHVLASGGSIAYGGDLRAGGYTEALLDLIRTYNRRDIAGPERVFCYFAWPLWLDLTLADKADIANLATLIPVDAPAGAPEHLPAPRERNPCERLLGSIALTAMRERMTADIGARIVLGGRVAGQQGLYPGVLEEAILGLRAGTPLFVSGGFGGCGRIVCAALRGYSSAELTLDFQLHHTPRYGELLEAGGRSGIQPRYELIVDEFARAGLEGLRNGLDASDNAQLAETNDVDEVVALVLRGLRRLEPWE